MKRLKTSIAAWSFVCTILGYMIAVSILPPEGVRNLAYALMASISFVGFIRWIPDALRSFRSGRAGAEFLIVGVTAILGILFLHRTWVIAMAYYPLGDTDSVTYFIVVMMAWACGLILAAPDVENGVIASRSLILIGVSLFVAGMVSGVSIALSLG